MPPKPPLMKALEPGEVLQVPPMPAQFFPSALLRQPTLTAFSQNLAAAERGCGAPSLFEQPCAPAALRQSFLPTLGRAAQIALPLDRVPTLLGAQPRLLPASLLKAFTARCGLPPTFVQEVAAAALMRPPVTPSAITPATVSEPVIAPPAAVTPTPVAPLLASPVALQATEAVDEAAKPMAAPPVTTSVGPATAAITVTEPAAGPAPAAADEDLCEM